MGFRATMLLGLIIWTHGVHTIDTATAAPSGNQFTDKRANDYSITLKGLTFKIPRDYVGFATTEAESRSGHAAVAIHALLPDFRPELFGTPLSTDSIFMAIDTHMQRSPGEELENWRHGNTFLHVGQGSTIRQVDGMEVRAADKATALSKSAPWDMYRIPSGDQEDQSVTLFCNQTTSSIPWSRCRDAFVHRGLLIKLTYTKNKLPEWRELRRKATRKIDEWIATKN